MNNQAGCLRSIAIHDGQNLLLSTNHPLRLKRLRLSPLPDIPPTTTTTTTTAPRYSYGQKRRRGEAPRQRILPPPRPSLPHRPPPPSAHRIPNPPLALLHHALHAPARHRPHVPADARRPHPFLFLQQQRHRYGHRRQQ